MLLAWEGRGLTHRPLTGAMRPISLLCVVPAMVPSSLPAFSASCVPSHAKAKLLLSLEGGGGCPALPCVGPTVPGSVCRARGPSRTDGPIVRRVGTRGGAQHQALPCPPSWRPRWTWLSGAASARPSGSCSDRSWRGTRRHWHPNASDPSAAATGRTTRRTGCGEYSLGGPRSSAPCSFPYADGCGAGSSLAPGGCVRRDPVARGVLLAAWCFAPQAPTVAARWLL